MLASMEVTIEVTDAMIMAYTSPPPASIMIATPRSELLIGKMSP